jgi:hypothetical protein
MNALYLISKIRYTADGSEPESRIDRLFSSRDRIDIDPPASPIEAHVSIHQRENRVIAAYSDIFPRQKFGSTLTDNDVTRDNDLATKFFHTQPLADAVAAILDAALSFFMSHFESR